MNQIELFLQEHGKEFPVRMVRHYRNEFDLGLSESHNYPSKMIYYQSREDAVKFAGEAAVVAAENGNGWFVGSAPNDD